MNEEQGALFETHVVPSGVTDPALVGKSTESYEPVPGGVYPEAATEAESVPEDALAVSALREAVKKDNRHKGQVGKHSPLQRDGAYADLENNTSFVKAGDVLPRFGIVTYSNMTAAEQHARVLEQERRDRRR